ncbi:MAG: ABC transporter, ATPase subunit [Candidatus Moranbacteria bacterium GW2011_GWF2_37_7]|nr:MAG: ABC transporter, ATPase subunit [Candidatus Moranbacteria bacterium GW2011_GWF2_37_7]
MLYAMNKKTDSESIKRIIDIEAVEKSLAPKRPRSHHVVVKAEKVQITFLVGGKHQKILKNVSISLYAGEFVVIYGPSGCGKSTLLHSILGLEKPSKGKIFLRDQDLYKLDDDKRTNFRREKIGMVFQAYNLIPTLTVIDNVALPQVFRGISREKRLLRAKILLQRFDILPQADRLPSELSGGQQQRVGIARALINEQPIIFADEPVGNLDSKSAKIVLDILYDLNVKDKKTVILVTHDPSLLKYATHIIYMKDGFIVGEKRFSPKQREVTVSSQLEQPFVSSLSGFSSQSTTISPIESSAAEKSKKREEMAKELVETMQIDGTETARAVEPKIIQTEPKITAPQKELTIGELIKGNREQEQIKK